MTTSFKHLKRLQEELGAKDKAAQDSAQKQALEKIEEGQEISSDAARRLQPQLGNQALKDLVSNQQKNAQANETELETEEEEELGEEVAEEQDLGEGVELEGPQLGGSGPPAAPAGSAPPGGPGGNPWDVGRLFGGDDDDDPGPARPTRRGRLRDSPIRNFDPLEDELFDEAPEEDARAIGEDSAEAILATCGPGASRPDLDRQGDAVYVAVEAVLDDPRALGRLAIDPEDLIETDGPWDPVGRPAEIGRFLADAADSPRSRSLGRVLASSIAALLPEEGGYAGGVARLAALAVCAEATEGGGARTDRAVMLALTAHVWNTAVDAARPLAAEGRLHAREILESALGQELELSAGARRLPPPSHLGGKALARHLPPPWRAEVPELDLRESWEHHIHPDDPELADFDALLTALTGGPDLSAEEPRFVTPEQIKPLLHAARSLMNAIGKAQVELAAGGLAVALVSPQAPLHSALRHGDQGLHQLAKAVLAAGRRIEDLEGLPYDQVESGEVDEAIRELRVAAATLDSLREWALGAMAGAVDA